MEFFIADLTRAGRSYRKLKKPLMLPVRISPCRKLQSKKVKADESTAALSHLSLKNTIRTPVLITSVALKKIAICPRRRSLLPMVP
jgi:hypothetical protein